MQPIYAVTKVFLDDSKSWTLSTFSYYEEAAEIWEKCKAFLCWCCPSPTSCWSRPLWLRSNCVVLLTSIWLRTPPTHQWPSTHVSVRWNVWLNPTSTWAKNPCLGTNQPMPSCTKVSVCSLKVIWSKITNWNSEKHWKTFCCLFSSEAVGRASQWYEGWRQSPPSNHCPNTTCGRATPDVRKEHFESTSQSRTRDTETGTHITHTLIIWIWKLGRSYKMINTNLKCIRQYKINKNQEFLFSSNIKMTWLPIICYSLRFNILFLIYSKIL